MATIPESFPPPPPAATSAATNSDRASAGLVRAATGSVAAASGGQATTRWSTRLARGVAAGLGLTTAGIGVWSFTDPASFAAWVQFPVHIHFLHDLGAFQIGIGLTLLLALVWRDALVVALGGFLAGNSLHVVSHLWDRSLGGRPSDWLWLSLASGVALLALVLYGRRRRGE